MATAVLGSCAVRSFVSRSTPPGVRRSFRLIFNRNIAHSPKKGTRWSHFMWSGVFAAAAGATSIVLWSSCRKKAGLSVASCFAGEYSAGDAKTWRKDESSFPFRRFEGKTIVITGAAGDIGEATAEAFAREGASVVLVDLPVMKGLLQKKASKLSLLGAPKVVVAGRDVSNAEDMQQMVDMAMRTCGRIDFFFNNAGIQGELKPIYEQNEATFKRLLDVNVFGVFLCLKLVSQAMIQSQSKGVIVNTASLAGMCGPPNMAAYAASKHAVIGLTKVAAADLAVHGIRVCAVSPGLLEGKMWGTQVRGQAECRKRLAGVYCVHL